MDYSFNGEIARRYGVDEAVLIHNLYWWITKNEANGRHYYEGRSWTYNSAAAFAELFPFWNSRKVRHMIEKLENAGALLVGNFNRDGRDRTRWFSLSDEVLEIYRGQDEQDEQEHQEPDKNRNMHLSNLANANDKNGKCILDDTDSKQTDSKQKTYSACFERLWAAYPNKRGLARVSQAKRRELCRLGEEQLMRCIERYLEELGRDEWRKPQNGSTFFNSGYVDYLDENYTPPDDGGDVWERRRL